MAGNNAVDAAATAANNAAPGIAGALDYISALGLATKITTVLGLAALALIAAYLLSQQWLATRNATIAQAVKTGNNTVLDTLLGNSNVDLASLDNQQKFAIATTEAKQRFLTRLLTYALAFFAFLALLGFIVVILRPMPAVAQPQQPIDPLTMAALLRYVPEAQRQAECVKTLPAATCVRVVAAIAGLATTPPSTPAVETAVSAALDKGTIAPVLARAVQKVNLVALGRPNGWDVDIFWCEGENAAFNRARAEAAAAALGQTPGERIAPGIVLGRIQAGARSSKPQRADAPDTGAGRFVLTDSSRGNAAAVAAIIATIAARTGSSYTSRPSATPRPWYIQLFDCTRPTPPFAHAGFKPINPALLHALHP